MKFKNSFFALLLLAVPALLASCDDDNDNNFDFVTEAVHHAFQTLYPQVQPYEWEIDGPYIKAEFYQTSKHYEAWFTPEGLWVRTETDHVGALPEPVANCLATTYADYHVDDVDWVETPTGNFYEVDLEKAGMPDFIVKIAPDGTVVQ